MNILDLIKVEEKDKNESSHIAIIKNGKVRYYISKNKNGKDRIVNTLSSYSKKHYIFKILLKYIPIGLLVKFKIAKYMRLDLDPKISEYINIINKQNLNDNNINFNIIVGTYGKHQKIVIQYFDSNKELYYKIGNLNSKIQMEREINFLINNKQNYTNIIIPKYIANYTHENINILVTESFKGKKVEPILNEDIYNVFKEISNTQNQYERDGVIYSFSHGDFAPWNMKRDEQGIVVFDWEYCGMRFYGFDLIHFTYQVNTLLLNMSEEKAIRNAVIRAQDLDHLISRVNIEKLITMYRSESKKLY